MLKRKDCMVGLVIVSLIISYINSNMALAVENKSLLGTNISVVQRLEEIPVNVNKDTLCVDKNNIVWRYKLLDDGNISVALGSNLSGVVEIPSELHGFTVSRIEKAGFKNNTKITQVVIPDTIKSIGEYAFYNCTSLSSIEIPSSVVDVEDFAFENTPWLNNKWMLNYWIYTFIM